jgi:hypothetical protein
MLHRYLLLAVTFTASLLPAAVPLVNLVDEQTLVAISVPNAPALIRDWEKSPVATTWNDPEIVKFLAPLREHMEVDSWDDKTKEATGLTVRELLGLATGELMIALPAFDPAKLEKNEAPGFLIALEVAGQEKKLAGILADSAEKKSIVDEKESYAGVDVLTRPLGKRDEQNADAPVKTISWAITDGVWIIGADKQSLFATIDALKQGGVSAALGKSERFLRMRERTAQAQALVYINFPAIYPILQEAVADISRKTAGQPNPLGIDAQAIFAALGLDAFGESYFAMQVNDAETRMNFGLTLNGDRGLVKLLAYEPGPAPKPDWVPAKWPSVSTARFSFVKAYAALEEMLDAISPMLSGMAQGQIRAYNRKLGIDIKRDLIGSLGDEFISAYAAPAAAQSGDNPALVQMDQLFAFSLSNETAFIKSIEALKSLAGPAAEQLFIKRDYLGSTIYTLNPPARPGATSGPRGFSYAIANRTLLFGIGSSATVEAALQGMASGDGGFWKREDVEAALSQVPADAMAVQVSDLRVMMSTFVDMAVGMQQAALQGAGDDAEKKTYLDVSARPDEDVIARHWGLATSYSTRTAEGLFSTWSLAHPQK